MDRERLSKQVRPMIKRIDPDLFARLMTLPSCQRTDLLEYFGQTPLAPAEVLRLSVAGAANVNDTYGAVAGK